jgi:hypothetical protein
MVAVSSVLKASPRRPGGGLTPRRRLGVQVGLTMGYNFYTIRFKDRSGLGSGFISSHF